MEDRSYIPTILIGLVLVIALVLGIVAAAMTDQEEQKAQIEQGKELTFALLCVHGRFSIDECDELVLDVDTKVIKDNATGVRYLYVADDQGSGLTVLVDQDGKPLMEEGDKDE